MKAASSRKNGTAITSSSRSTMGQGSTSLSAESERIPPLRELGDGPHSEVQVALGHTVNLGNYNSYRVDVHVRVPVNRGEEGEGIEYARTVAEGYVERIKEQDF